MRKQIAIAVWVALIATLVSPVISFATKVCPKCGQEFQNEYNFCDQCGAALVELIKCPNCGMEWPEGTKFCANCGAELMQSEEQVKTILEGETLHLIDLIDSGDYQDYGDMIKLSGCSISEGIMTISSPGYLQVGVSDKTWADYEVSGMMSLCKVKDDSDEHLRIFVHNNPLGQQFKHYGKEMIALRPGSFLDLCDLEADTDVAFNYKWHHAIGWDYHFNNDIKDSTRYHIPDPEKWFDFRIIAEGFSVTMFVDDKKSLFSDKLSCESGGFSFEPYNYTIYLKDLEVNIYRVGQ